MSDLNGFTIDESSRQLTVDGQPVKVGARAFDVLVFLDENRNRVVSKQDLLEHVWGNLTVEEGNLTVQISALRKVLGQRAISTVPGVGYRLSLTATAKKSAIDQLPLPEKPSLVVLPFANLTGDPSIDYLVDGVVTELISALSRIPAFFVIAASSSFALKGKTVDLSEVGQQLGVRYILEGGIQQAAGQLRVNTHLVEADTGHSIWSERFTGAMTDIFDLQDAMTERVAAALEPNVIFAEARLAASRPTRDLDAYTLCLKAAPRIYRMAEPQSFETAMDLLGQALEHDPSSVEAKTLICRAHMMACAARFITFAQARTVLSIAEELLVMPDIDATSLALAGHYVAYIGHQFQRGLEATQRAVSLNPNSSMSLVHAAWVHSYLGHGQEANTLVQRAIRLNPIDPRSPQIRSGLGMALLAEERFEEALVELKTAYAAAPAWATSYNGLIICYTALGRMDDARKFRDLLLASAPDTTISGHLKETPHQNAVHLAQLERAYRAVEIPE